MGHAKLFGHCLKSGSKSPKKNNIRASLARTSRFDLTKSHLMVAKAGIEPATHGFSVRCSTN